MSATVLVVSRDAMLGGMERVTLMGMEAARSRGYNVLFATMPGGPLSNAAAERGFEIIPCDLAWLQHTVNPARLAVYAARLAREGARIGRICRQRNVRLIHTHGPVAALYAAHSSKWGRIPMLAHMHDAQKPKRMLILAARLVATAPCRFVCVSETVRRNVTGIGIPPERTEVLYNAVQPQYLQDPPGAAPEPMTGPGPAFVMCAQIVPWKGQHIFLEAAALVAARCDSARFFVVGTLAHPDDQPYLDSLHAAAESGLLRGRVTFAGYQPNVPEWLAAADVVVHCSVQGEAFGLVIAEAMALGKRVVATDVGGPREIIEDGVTGRIVPPADSRALADAMMDLAMRPPGDPMGASAARFIRERFTPERFGDDLAALYGRTLHPSA